MHTVDSYRSGVTDSSVSSLKQQLSTKSGYDNAIGTPLSWQQMQPSQLSSPSPYHQQQQQQQQLYRQQQQQIQIQNQKQLLQQNQYRQQELLLQQERQQQYQLQQLHRQQQHQQQQQQQQQQRHQQQLSNPNISSKSSSSFRLEPSVSMLAFSTSTSPRLDSRVDQRIDTLSAHTHGGGPSNPSPNPSSLDPLERAIRHLDADDSPHSPPGLSVPVPMPKAYTHF
jgi:hypothetical protein